MKSLNFILILACVATLCFADGKTATKQAPIKKLNTAEFDRMFDTLNSPRVGLSDDKITSLRNPFGFRKDTSSNDTSGGVSSISLSYKLVGTMGNKAKINDRWYNLGDNIGSYKVSQINENSVIISNEYNTVEIKINQGNNNVIITYK